MTDQELDTLMRRLPKLSENTSRITAAFCATFFHRGRARLRSHFSGSFTIAAICR